MIGLDDPGIQGMTTNAALSPEAVALRADLRPIVRNALERLPEELRTTLILQVYEDLKYREIATILEIPIGTVMSRLHAARARLREELKDHEL